MPNNFSPFETDDKLNNKQEKNVQNKILHILSEDKIPSPIPQGPTYSTKKRVKKSNFDGFFNKLYGNVEPYLLDFKNYIFVTIKNFFEKLQKKRILSILVMVCLLIVIFSVTFALKDRITSPSASAKTKKQKQINENKLTASLNTETTQDAQQTWLEKVQNVPGNNITPYESKDKKTKGTLFASGNNGEENYNRFYAPQITTDILGNFILQAKFSFEESYQTNAVEKVFAIRLSEYTPDPFSAPYVEAQFSNKSSLSTFKVITNSLDKRINPLSSARTKAQLSTTPSPTSSVLGLETEIATKSPTLYPTKIIEPGSVLGTSTEKPETLNQMFAYIRIQRSSGSLIFQNSPDGQTWKSFHELMIDNLTNQLGIRIFQYSPAMKVETSGILSDLSVISKNSASITTQIQSAPKGINVLRQWAYKARASTQYSNDAWSANKATKESDTQNCGDYPTAWASSSAEGKEWLELYYQKPVFATQIRVHETNNPGHVYLIEVRDTEGNYEEIWKGADLTECGRYLEINFLKTDKQISTVRINIDETDAKDWAEIDAVELIGYEK